MSVLSDVSLYIPARNSEATLTACLDAVARLDPAPAEVLVVADPRSRDRTLEVARTHGAARVEVQQRPGLTGARNQAYTTLKTPWVAAIDSDVVVAPDWLGQLAEARTNFPQAAGISARTEERIAGVGDLWRALMHPHHWGAHPLAGPFMIVSEAIMRREAVLAVGGYRESLARYGDDSRLCRDLRDAGYELAYWPHARGVHVRHDDARGVLDLRWDYGAPRMGDALDDLAGLRRKSERNLQFARLAVSRGLSAEAPQMALLGALLPIHHALRDLEAMLARRRMDAAMAGGAVERLRDTMIAAVRSWPALAELAASCLGVGEATPRDLPWPAWSAFLSHQQATLSRWVVEARGVIGVGVSPVTKKVVRGWAARFGAHEHPWAESELWHAPRSVSPWFAGTKPKCLATYGADGKSRDRDRDGGVARHRLYEGRRVTVLSAADRRPDILGATHVHQVHRLDEMAFQPGIVVIPKLGDWSNPRRLLREALTRAEGAVISYRPPERLGQGEMLMAGDIAEACARAGLGIESFDTIVGDTVIGAYRRAVETVALAA